MTQLPDELWDACLALYSLPGMEAFCLRLQDDRSVNVNLLLWCVWMDVRRQAFEPEIVHRGRQAVVPRHYVITLPLRSIRRKLSKTGPMKNIRCWIKNRELESERREIASLERVLPSRNFAARDSASWNYVRTLLSRNIASAAQINRELEMLERLTAEFDGQPSL